LTSTKTFEFIKQPFSRLYLK